MPSQARAILCKASQSACVYSGELLTCFSTSASSLSVSCLSYAITYHSYQLTSRETPAFRPGFDAAGRPVAGSSRTTACGASGRDAPGVVINSMRLPFAPLYDLCGRGFAVVNKFHFQTALQNNPCGTISLDLNRLKCQAWRYALNDAIAHKSHVTN